MARLSGGWLFPPWQPRLLLKLQRASPLAPISDSSFFLFAERFFFKPTLPAPFFFLKRSGHFFSALLKSPCRSSFPWLLALSRQTGRDSPLRVDERGFSYARGGGIPPIMLSARSGRVELGKSIAPHYGSSISFASRHRPVQGPHISTWRLSAPSLKSSFFPPDSPFFSAYTDPGFCDPPCRPSAR